MAVFTVFSEFPQVALRTAIEQKFPNDFYHWSDTISFVKSSGTAKGISTQLGIKNRTDGDAVHGNIDAAFVMRASPSYWGWSKSSLWEWLQASFEDEN